VLRILKTTEGATLQTNVGWGQGLAAGGLTRKYAKSVLVPSYAFFWRFFSSSSWGDKGKPCIKFTCLLQPNSVISHKFVSKLLEDDPCGI